MNPDDTVARGVAVVMDPGAVQAVTADNGMAWRTINTGDNPGPLTITVCL